PDLHPAHDGHVTSRITDVGIASRGLDIHRATSTSSTGTRCTANTTVDREGTASATIDTTSTGTTSTGGVDGGAGGALSVNGGVGGAAGSGAAGARGAVNIQTTAGNTNIGNATGYVTIMGRVQVG